MKTILVRLGIGNFAFDKLLWNQSKKFRKHFVNDILKRSIGLGMSEEELAETFGEERKVYTGGVVSYTIRHSKNTKKRSTLNFYLNQDGKVDKIKYKK